MSVAKREERQQRAFLGWVNYHLDDGGFPRIKSLGSGFKKGSPLLQLLEVLTGIELSRKGNMRAMIKAQELDNLHIAFKFLEAEGFGLVGIGPNDVWEENSKLIMGLMWQLILFYQVSSSAADEESADGSAAAQEVIDWVNTRIAPFDVQVTDLTSSFQDGKAFAALVASLDATYDRSAVVATPSAASRALKSAEQRLAVPALVEAADLMDLDHKVVLTYLGMMYDKFGHLPPTQPAVQRADHTVVRGTVRGRPQSLAPPPGTSLFGAFSAESVENSATGAAPMPADNEGAVSGAGFARESHLTSNQGGYDGVATAPPPPIPARDRSPGPSRTASGYAPPDRSAPPPPPPAMLSSSAASSTSALSSSSGLAPPGLPLAGVSPTPSPNSSPRSKEVTIEYEDPLDDDDFPDMDVASAEYAEFKAAKRLDIDKLYFVIDYPQSRFRLGGVLTVEVRIKDNHGRKVKNHGSILEAQIEGPSGLIVLQAEKVADKLGLWEVNFSPSIPGLYLAQIVYHRKYIQNRWAKLKVTAPKKGSKQAPVSKPVFLSSASTTNARETIVDQSGGESRFIKCEGLGFESFFKPTTPAQEKEQAALRKQHEKAQAALEMQTAAENQKREKAQSAEMTGHEAGITKELEGWRRREKERSKLLLAERAALAKQSAKERADDAKARRTQLKADLKQWTASEKQRVKDESAQLKITLKSDKSTLKSKTKQLTEDSKLAAKFYPEHKQLRLQHELQNEELMQRHEHDSETARLLQELAIEQLDQRFAGQRTHMQKRHQLLKAQQNSNLLAEQSTWSKKYSLIGEQANEQKELDIAMHKKNSVAELADLKQNLVKKQKLDVKNYNIQKKEQAKELTKQLKQMQADNKKTDKLVLKDMLAKAKADWEESQRRQDEEFARSQEDELTNSEAELEKRLETELEAIIEQHEVQQQEIRHRHQNNLAWLEKKNEKDTSFLADAQISEVEALFSAQQKGQINALTEHHKSRMSLWETQMKERQEVFLSQCAEKKTFLERKIAEIESNAPASPVSEGDREELKHTLAGEQGFSDILKLEESKFLGVLEKEKKDLAERQARELDEAKAQV
eukprot:CAMPEP_0177646188 /NCGR_PEP_ID=MMETSP0447-20121125/9643_1 /TAXON_ID=0 /ORGANISM="Stygamoeba regulata, Strain BSH-02190019" /LENGTH=1082 /DNA_ID=CAMNT_0019148709 /DNA_START=58 /DNA_END=3306 /DNA_ORIENTATION=+